MSTPNSRTGPLIGRGSEIRPANRFERTRVEDDFEHCEEDKELPGARRVPTEFLPDRTQKIITENDSPDIGFRYSINPYRGCEHGCSYCYARPTHEMLGMNAGIDFETKVLVKHDAARLLRDELAAGGWRGEHIMLSGVTDCYQPAERQFRLTRLLLEVMLEARQAVSLITKNALVLRDLDLLKPMAELHLVQVYLSVTTLDGELARAMEPRTATPAARLRAVAELSAAGVPVGVMVAPVIPGLTDIEMPQILQAAKDAGAQAAGYVLLRLPWTVQPVFLEWLAANRPAVKDRVESLIRETRGGKLYDSTWKARQRGQGAYAEQIQQTFRVFAHKLGLDRSLPELDTSLFRPPRPSSGQLSLF
jgi:DNA repair photolyase